MHEVAHRASRPSERRQRSGGSRRASRLPSTLSDDERDAVAARLRQAAGALVRVDHALVQRGAVGVEVDETGERAQREVALAVAAEQVGDVAERLRIELVALEPAVRDLARAVELAGVRQRLDERAVLLAAVGALRRARPRRRRSPS